MKFLDGPAANRFLRLQRRPYFLRAVIASDGKVDALDDPDDVAAPSEKVFVYIRVTEVSNCHVDGRDKHGKRFGRWEQIADYRLFPEPPDDATARDNAKWQAWCKATYAELTMKEKV